MKNWKPAFVFLFGPFLAAVLSGGCSGFGRITAEMSREHTIRKLVFATCVDHYGQPDKNVVTGRWIWSACDIDLNADDAPERFVFLYDWKRLGDSPERARRNFENRPVDARGNPVEYWIVNGVLLLEVDGGEWKVRSYQFRDGGGIPVWIEKSTETGLPILVSGGTDAVWAWGAPRLRAPVRYLERRWTSAGYSTSEENFMIRAAYGD